MTAISATSLMQLRSDALQRSASLQASAPIASPTVAPHASIDFGKILKVVNATQAEAGAVSAAFERGDTTDIAAVMLARQKAGIAFEATLQTRNKLLSAYRDIMNMPV